MATFIPGNEEIGKKIKEEKLAIKEHNRKLNELRSQLNKDDNKKIDKIIENIPLTDPKGNIVAFAIKYESGMLLLYSTINCYKL